MPHRIWWKSVNRQGHGSQWPYMTFDLGMTLTSRSYNERPTYTHVMYQVWWKSGLRYRDSSQKSKIDLWPWGDLDLWPIENPVARDEVLIVIIIYEYYCVLMLMLKINFSVDKASYFFLIHLFFNHRHIIKGLWAISVSFILPHMHYHQLSYVWNALAGQKPSRDTLIQYL